jgi:CRP/FNR family transcriptional regulator, polysaccharide utilization system transcription regulator
LIDLAYNSVRKRVADALIRLQDRYHNDGQNVFTMSILRDDLASIVGTAKETVIRTLSDFKEEGLIDIKGSRITIVENKKLENMFN